MTFPPEVWTRVLCLLKAELPAHSWGAWLEPLVPEEHSGGLRLHCRSAFHRDRVRDRFLAEIRAGLAQQLGRSVPVELCIDEPNEEKVGTSPESRAEPADSEVESAQLQTPSQLQVLSIPPAAATRSVRPATHTPVQQRFANFVVGRCNALAREASVEIARGPDSSLQQLYLASASGLGKTHLSRAVVQEAKREGASNVLYTSAEGFTNDFMSAVRTNQMADFKRRYRQRSQLLVVEDVQFFAGKAQTQLELFYTLRHVMEAGGRVVITGDRLPQDLSALDGQLRSQIASGFVARLETPDAQVRREILSTKASSGGIRLPEDALQVLIESVRGSVRDLESALIQLVTTASLLKRPIDGELARQALAARVDSGSESSAAPATIDSIIRIVSSYFQTSPEALASRSRRRDVLLPRQLAMYLCRRYTPASMVEIGRAFDRSHPSVKNAIAKVERDIVERAPIRYKLEALVDRIRPN